MTKVTPSPLLIHRKYLLTRRYIYVIFHVYFWNIYMRVPPGASWSEEPTGCTVGRNVRRSARHHRRIVRRAEAQEHAHMRRAPHRNARGDLCHAFEQEPLLRIHQGGLGARQPEGRCIESVDGRQVGAETRRHALE